MDSKLEKWHRWFHVISDEVTRLVSDDGLYWKVHRMIKENPRIDVPNPFFTFLSSAYASHAVSGIRRLVKPQNDSITFVGLLRDMEASPQSLTREYYRSLFGQRAQVVADGAFTRFHGARDHFDPAIATQDIAELERISKHIEDFSDRRVAHRDRRDPERLPTFKEVKDCISGIDALCVKYHMILHGNVVGRSSMDIVQPWTWLQIFRTPWIENTAPSNHAQERTAAGEE